MKKVTRSARGVVVDFDLLRIKQQMVAAPPTTDVKARESFIDQKFKRRLKRLTQETVIPKTDPIPEPEDTGAEPE